MYINFCMAAVFMWWELMVDTVRNDKYHFSSKALGGKEFAVKRQSQNRGTL